MRLRVTRPFQDKETLGHYVPGDLIDIKDTARVKDIVGKGLAEKMTEGKAEKEK